VGIAKAWMDQQYPAQEKKTEGNDHATQAGAKGKKGKLATVVT